MQTCQNKNLRDSKSTTKAIISTKSKLLISSNSILALFLKIILKSGRMDLFEVCQKEPFGLILEYQRTTLGEVAAVDFAEVLECWCDFVGEVVFFVEDFVNIVGLC